MKINAARVKNINQIDMTFPSNKMKLCPRRKVTLFGVVVIKVVGG